MSKDLHYLLMAYEDYIVHTKKNSLGTAETYSSHLRSACVYTRLDKQLEKIASESGTGAQLSLCYELYDALTELKNDPDCPRELSTVGNYQSAVKTLIEYLLHLAGAPAPTVTKAVKPVVTVTLPEESYTTPCLMIPLGKDEKAPHVSYKSVPESKRVTGLCSYIEELLHGICRFASELLESFFPDGEIPLPTVILSAKCPTKYWYKGDGYIAKEIAEKGAREGRPLDADEILPLLQDNCFCDRMLGRFCHEGPHAHIEIYFMNFDTKSRSEFLTVIANTLAHECMHYFEHLYREYTSHDGEKALKVSEAMAEFFSVLYSLSIGHKAVSHRRYDAWEERFGSHWHYAEALRFYTVGGFRLPFSDNYRDYGLLEPYYDSVTKLLEVFARAKDSEAAYDTLVNT